MRSRVLTGIKGWVLVCEDPDKKIVRISAMKDTSGQTTWMLTGNDWT